MDPVVHFEFPYDDRNRIAQFYGSVFGWELKMLGEGGPVEAQQCGWLRDRFGLAWQVIPRRFIEMMSDPDKARVQRVFAAMMKMKKLDLPALERAFNGA